MFRLGTLSAHVTLRISRATHSASFLFFVITSTPTEDDVQPHPLVGDSAVMLELYWGRAAPVGQNNFRIVRDAAVAVMDDVLFADGFE